MLVASTQLAPPSLLTCTVSPAPSEPCVPDTVSVVSLVTKSLDEVPLSVAMAVIATAAVGATASTVTGVAVELAPALPAMSVSPAVTLNVPWPCAASVARGTVTVALLPEMSAARSV